MDNSEEKVDDDRETEKKKAIQASVESTPRVSESQKRRPTQRYGIEVVMQVEDNQQMDQQK